MCDNHRSGMCGRNNNWNCDSSATCKHSQYDLWVKSNYTDNSLNITFTCKLPSLPSGSHSLTVITKIYESEIELRPSSITFRVSGTNEIKIFDILGFPIKIIKDLIYLFSF